MSGYNTDTDTDTDTDSYNSNETTLYYESSSNSDNSYSSSDDDDDVFDDVVDSYRIHNAYRIAIEEQQFRHAEKNNNNYYIGIAILYSSVYSEYTPRLLLSCAVSNKTFFKYKYLDVISYLKKFSTFNHSSPKIHIMKLHNLNIGNFEIHSVVLKTYWIRIIQRHWKSVIRKRQDIYNKRHHLYNLRYREVHGKHKPGLNVLPGLYGMLYMYKFVVNKDNHIYA